MESLSIAQYTALAVFALALTQLGLWLGGLYRRRSALVLRRTEDRRVFARKLARIQAMEKPKPKARAWRGEREFVVRERALDGEDNVILDLYPTDSAVFEPFLPGQHLFLSVDQQSASTKQNDEKRRSGWAKRQARVVRCYSILNSPADAFYRIAVRRIQAPADLEELPVGYMSNYVYDKMLLGSTVSVKAPSGHFYFEFDANDNTPLVLIGLDIGLLALMSIIEFVSDNQPDRAIALYYYSESFEASMQRAALLRLAAANQNLSITLCLEQAEPGSSSELIKLSTNLSGEELLAKLESSEAEFYVAGYTTACNRMIDELLDAGVPHYAIRSEFYKIRRAGDRRKEQRRRNMTAPSKRIQHETPNDEPKTLPQISFSQSGQSLPWKPTAGSLLEFAEDAGIDLPSDCRMGSCHTCMSPLKSGEVEYIQPPYNDPDAGHCLPCIAIPKTDIELEI